MILCETTRNENQHVAFIAALMVAYRYAFPNETIELWTNKSKNINVIECLKSFDQSLEGLRFVDIYRHEGANTSMVSKAIRQLDAIFSLLKLTIKSNRDTLAFCSTHRLPLLYFRVLRTVIGRRINQVFAIIHDIGMFSHEEHNYKKKRFFDSRSVFGKRITPVCLSKNLAAKAEVLLNTNAQKAIFFDIPCLWVSKHSSNLTESPDCLRFVFAGISKKGLSTYFQLASSICKKHENVEFWVAGSCSEKERELYEGTLKGLTPSWLDQMDYQKILSSAHYLILPFNGARYDNRVSATLLDAFSVLKPSICLKNSFVAECFERMGDVGYQCANYSELFGVVDLVCAKFPLDKYNQQCRKLEVERTLFDCETVGQQIRLFSDQR